MVNKKHIIPLTGILFLLLIGVVSAVSTIDHPLSTHTMTGTGYNISATFDNASVQVNAVNVTWYIKLSSASTWTQLNNSANTSINQVLWNNTFNTALFSDSSSYDINVSFNTTNQTIVTVATTGVDLDNTAPSTASCTVSPSGVINNNQIVRLDFSGSADTTDTALSPSATLFRDQTALETVSQNNDTTTILQFTKTSTPGKYTILCTVTDNIALSTSATNQSITVTSNGDNIAETLFIAEQVAEKQSSTKDKTMVIIVSAVTLMIIVIGAYFLSIKKPKKRR